MVALIVNAALLSLVGAPAGFAQRQAQPARVRQARVEKSSDIKELFEAAGVAYPPARLYLRAFKHEDDLELWAGDRGGSLRLVKHYRICAKSGHLGPKRRRGDLQVPEGFYVVDRYNAWSTFHLSLGINYPNLADRILGHRPDPGGDIFIHGYCVTIGCLPVENAPTQEIYLIALDTYLAGQVPAVHIFPTRMDDAGMQRLRQAAKGHDRLLEFWVGLRPAYLAFEESRRLPRISVDPTSGAYRIVPAP